MPRKCPNKNDSCSCIFQYPDGSYVAGSGTSDNPYLFDNCSPLFRIRDCEARTVSVSCGDELPILPGLDRENRFDYPDGAVLTVNPVDGLLIGQVGAIKKTFTRSFFNEDFQYSIPRLGTVGVVECFDLFDLDIKNTGWYTLHITLEICQEIPAPTTSAGECAEIFLALSNRFGTTSSNFIQEELDTQFWYPPASSNSRGCRSFSWIQPFFAQADSYNEVCLSLSYNRSYDSSPVYDGDCFINPSRRLVMTNMKASITS